MSQPTLVHHFIRKHWATGDNSKSNIQRATSANIPYEMQAFQSDTQGHILIVAHVFVISPIYVNVCLPKLSISICAPTKDQACSHKCTRMALKARMCVIICRCAWHCVFVCSCALPHLPRVQYISAIIINKCCQMQLRT